MNPEVRAIVNLSLTSLNKEKILKIFQHTLKLYPCCNVLLNAYGEFLERIGDVINADHMYLKATTWDATYEPSLTNRIRTEPIVKTLDKKLFTSVEYKKNIFNYLYMRKENLPKHIFHSAAIEGNTLTISEIQTFLETRIVKENLSLQYNEIRGLEDAFLYVTSFRGTSFRGTSFRGTALTVENILEIHKHVFKYINKDEAGVTRTGQVFIYGNATPDASTLLHLLKGLINYINTSSTYSCYWNTSLGDNCYGSTNNSIHPIELAAIAHYRFVKIHPFYDGNGRTGRLLMNLLLIKHGFPFCIIEVKKKDEYFQLIQEAGVDVRPFIRFIARCLEENMTMTLDI